MEAQFTQSKAGDYVTTAVLAIDNGRTEVVIGYDQEKIAGGA